MGLFSSKKKTSVDTQVNRVIDDEFLPDIGKESLIQAVLENGSIAEYLMEGTLSGVGLKFERMHRYAKKSYKYGLPNDNHQTTNTGASQVRQILELQHGKAVNILYCEAGALNSLHYARQTLTESYGYNEASNQIGKLGGNTQVYLVDLIPLVPAEDAEDDEAGLVEYWGLPGKAGVTPDRKAQALLQQYVEHTPYLVDARYPFHGALVKYAHWKDGLPVTGELALEMPADDLEADFFQVRYQVEGETTVRYWRYRVGEGTYPSLEGALSTSYTEAGTYWPFVLFRREKVNRTATTWHDTEEYKTTQKMLEYVNIDFQQMGEAIHENPDIKDVEQAAMVMAVPAKTQHPLEMEYLFEYFKSLYLEGYDADSFNPSGGSKFSRFLAEQRRGKNVITLQDAGYQMHMDYTSLHIRNRSGKIGPVGTYSNELGSSQKEVKYQVNVDGELETRTRLAEVKGRVFRKQVTDTLYEELVVEGLRLRYEIWKGHETKFTADADELLIPLDKAITDQFSLQQREVLLTRSLHLVFNSRVTQKVKWYQSGIFKAVLVIAAIVIAFYTGQFEAIQLAIAAGSVAAVAMAVLTVVVKTVGFQMAFKYTAKAIGPEAAFVLAIVAMAVGAGKGMKAGGLKNAPWATELLAAGTGLMNAVGGAYGELIEDLQGDYMDLLETQDARMEELDNANALLGSTVALDPLTFIEGETPDNFYQRTVHSGNIGAVGIDAIHHYATLALKLPEPHETYEAFSYGD